MITFLENRLNPVEKNKFHWKNEKKKNNFAKQVLASHIVYNLYTFVDCVLIFVVRRRFSEQQNCAMTGSTESERNMHFHF